MGKQDRIAERFEKLKGDAATLRVGGEKFNSAQQLISRVQTGKGHLIVLLNSMFKASATVAPAPA